MRYNALNTIFFIIQYYFNICEILFLPNVLSISKAQSEYDFVIDSE